MRTIAIGDIHGCAKALRSLIEAIKLTPADRLIALGDYVDRGPDSREVIEQLIELSRQCKLIPLLGNHEIMLQRALDEPHEMHFWLECGGDATLASYGGRLERIPAGHIQFINNCRRYYETAKHIFLHANYAADIPLDEQPDHLLFWEHLVYSLPARHESGKTAIVGHTPQLSGEILDLGHILCIDTYCFGTGWLTALDVQTGQLWQADKLGKLRTS